MSRMLYPSLVAVTMAAFVGYASASQEPVEPVCLTNEIDKELISSSLAITAGECHLNAAEKDQQQAMQHAQLAYSWFAYAQRLSGSVSPKYLQQAAAKIDELQVK
ncbi:hypothetical protein SBP02_20795 [Pseudomonas benzenivorans]|uniref:Uncharacterized protein n=1 Tax=Pseudomonas benzenivorans TaxID=556533 RepID=A0ABZ0PVD4_9PSED|nr:hypothetical protein [Pseudomonas benzenivorans]WPC05163.1 hypothetical protein SBP02_20795 [Pseudomonas benzenivorans]